MTIQSGDILFIPERHPINLGEGVLPLVWVGMRQTLRFVLKSQRNGRDEGRVFRVE
jgi:hypothetical protein